MRLPRIATTDYHTAGEPFRIVAEPPVALPGATVAERRALALTDPGAQHLRQVLCFEPRGHADMYGGLVVPPDDDGATLGVLFWHKDGFSTACGHGTIALGAWAVDTGRVPVPADGSVDVVVDVPSGRVTARVHRAGGGTRARDLVNRPRYVLAPDGPGTPPPGGGRGAGGAGGRTVAVDFVNVPSYVLARDVPVTTSRGEVRVTVAYGGAIYAQLAAADVGLRVVPEDLAALVAVGREVKAALTGSEVAVHPG